MTLSVGMVAGEVSGDLLAGLLLEGLHARWRQLHAYGIGGPAMGRQGFEALWPHEKLAVRGYFEVLRHYREIVGIREQLAQRLLADKPPLFIGVDAPDFNLALEARLRDAGIRTVHYVCPSIWAWRPGRVEKIRRSADHVLCVFPFEPALLASHGIGATYVGHPLANVIPQTPDKAAARRALGLADSDEVLAVLPGSRASEVKYLARLFFEAAGLVQRARPGLKLVVPAIAQRRAELESAARSAGLGDGLMILDGQSHTALAACDLTLIASGTATLEAALFKRPMVISYRVNTLSWQIMRHQALQPWVGLPNILLGEMAVPELLQSAATAPALAGELIAWLESPQRREAVCQKFEALHHELRRDTATLATDAIAQVLQG